jgi:hypothetical protein
LAVALSKISTGTFTFGDGESKAELDEIVQQALVIRAK